VRRYGGSDTFEDKTKCAAAIYKGSDWEQCSRPRGHGEGGLLCKQHATTKYGVNIPKDIDEDVRVAEFKKESDDSRAIVVAAFDKVLAAITPENESEFDRAWRQHRKDRFELRRAKEDRERARAMA
jgi:hypothetical protein